MTKRLAPLAFSAFALLAAGCAEAPQPAAAALGAAELEQLVARLDAEAAAANPPVRGALPEKVASADRFSNTITRMAPERLDPNLVVSAIAR
jgi:hypothetical protein